jgi:hypothetical protein
MQRQFVSAALVIALSSLCSVLPLRAGDEAPTKKVKEQDPEARIKDALAKLSEVDRNLVEAQRYCPIQTEMRLGSMGPPVKLEVSGKPVFLCCAACREDALADPKATLASAEKLKKVTAALGKLKPADRAIAEKQRLCPMMEDSRLGSMGTPVRIEIKGQPVFLCCEGCREDALADPTATLKKATELSKPKKEEKPKSSKSE